MQNFSKFQTVILLLDIKDVFLVIILIWFSKNFVQSNYWTVLIQIFDSYSPLVWVHSKIAFV